MSLRRIRWPAYTARVPSRFQFRRAHRRGRIYTCVHVRKRGVKNHAYAWSWNIAGAKSIPREGCSAERDESSSLLRRARIPHPRPGRTRKTGDFFPPRKSLHQICLLTRSPFHSIRTYNNK